MQLFKYDKYLKKKIIEKKFENFPMEDHSVKQSFMGVPDF